MAGATLGFLKFVLGFDTLSFSKGATQAEADLKRLQKSFDKQGKALANAGKTLTLGITAPLAAFGALSFKTASDAAELQSSFDTTFGKMSGAMNKWAEETGNALGRSTQEMQKAANTFGIFFNTAVPPGKAAAMSQTFSKLAQDLGSFFNVDTNTAIEKLRAGLSGESEPLRAFGVFLTEASVKAKALELGLTGVGNELTEQEKIQARYALILEQTAKAQGDVERTSGGTANQIRKAKAAFEELQVIVGTKLLPVLTPLIEKLASALSWFTSLPAPIQNVVLGVAAFSATLGPILSGLGVFVPLLAKLSPIVAALGPLLKVLGVALGIVSRALLAMLANPIILGAALVIGGIYLAWKNWDKIAPIVQKMVAGVTSFLMKLAAPLKWVIDRVGDVNRAFYNLADKVVFRSYIPDMVVGIGHWIAKLDALMVRPALAGIAKVTAAFAAMPDLVPATPTAEGSAGGDVPGAVDEFGKGTAQLAKDADQAKAQVIESFGQMASGVVSSLKDMVASFKSGDILGGIQQVLDMVLQVLSALSKAGVFGGGSAGGSFGGGLASGGPVVPGKTYLVGERGPELFSTGRSGFIHPNGSGGGGAVRVDIGLNTPLFNVAVDGRARNVAAPMALQGAMMGASGAATASERRQRKNLSYAR